MTEPENFIERWSKRKRAAADPAAPQDDGGAPPPKDDETTAPAAAKEASLEAGNQPFDPASLPSIESIGTETDVTGFLKPGVPPELTRAALRRAWTTDPAIRDFVGLVENGWDFNDPQAMAGFGPIAPGEVARLVKHFIGEPPAPSDAAPADAPKQAALSAPQDEPRPANAPQQDATEAEPVDVQRSAENDAPQKNLKS